MNLPIKKFYGANFSEAAVGINLIKNFRLVNNDKEIVIYYYNILLVKTPLNTKNILIQKPEIEFYREHIEFGRFSDFDKLKEVQKIRRMLLIHLKMEKT